MKRFSISTLGCKVNSFESEIIAQKLEQRYQRVTHKQEADLCVINTCTVTAEADRQARQLIRRVIRKNPSAQVVVTGCYAQIDPDACSAIPGVDLVMGNAGKLDIPKFVDQLEQKQLPPIMIGDVAGQADEKTESAQLISGFDSRTRAFVQIQQGCDQGCTFCIIHTARGPNRSFSMGMIARQAQRLVENGYRELVICGVDIGSYGTDFAESDNSLTDLLKQLVTIDGDFRIRLSSIDPAHLTDPLIEFIASEPKICPHLHLSMQSGNTLILKRMKRRATREVLYERVGKLRHAMPELVLSADILVGFPTETEAHFQETLEAVDELEIAYPHVFAYSPRAGTPAAKIPSQVEVSERKRRAALVRERGQQVWKKVAARQLGMQYQVLVEGGNNSSNSTDSTDGLAKMVRGRAANYFPVLFESKQSKQAESQPDAGAGVGEWAVVKITSVKDDFLIAETPNNGYNNEL